MTLKIVMEMKRCSEGAHSSPHSPADSGAPGDPPLSHRPGAAVGSVCASKGSSASALGCFCAFISNNEPEGSSKAAAEDGPLEGTGLNHDSVAGEAHL